MTRDNPLGEIVRKTPFVVSLSKTPFVVSLSNHERPFDGLRANGFGANGQSGMIQDVTQISPLTFGAIRKSQQHPILSAFIGVNRRLIAVFSKTGRTPPSPALRERGTKYRYAMLTLIEGYFLLRRAAISASAAIQSCTGSPRNPCRSAWK